MARARAERVPRMIRFPVDLDAKLVARSKESDTSIQALVLHAVAKLTGSDPPPGPTRPSRVKTLTGRKDDAVALEAGAGPDDLVVPCWCADKLGLVNRKDVMVRRTWSCGKPWCKP